jgi:hypothetical protein
MVLANKFIFPFIALILTLAFGFWLSCKGKPYNGVLFNLHKLIALGGVIYAGWQFAQVLKTAASPALLPVLLAVAALGVIALFASGGLLSAGQLDYVLMLLIHRIGIGVLAVCVGIIAYLLTRST